MKRTLIFAAIFALLAMIYVPGAMHTYRGSSAGGGYRFAEGDLPRASALLAPLRPAAISTKLETQVYQTILERQPA